MAAGGYDVKLSVLDDYTKGIADFNKKLASMQAPAKRLEAQLSKFGKLTGLTEASKAVKNLGSDIASTALTAVKFGASLAGISAVGSIGGIYALAKGFGEMGISLTNTSASLGITAGQLQTWQNAARLTGVSTGALDSSLTSLSDTMQDALAGRNVNAARMFQYLGIDIRKSAFEAKQATDILPKLADKIASLNNNPALQRNLARSLGVEGILPFLRQGSAGIRDYQNQVAQFTTMNKPGVESADRLYTAFTKLSMAGEAFGYTIAQTIEPVLTPFLGDLNAGVMHLRAWVIANQGLIQTKLSEWLKDVEGWFSKIDWKGIADGAGWFARNIKTITEVSLAVWAGRQITGLIPLIRLLALIPGSGITAGVMAAAGIAAVTAVGLKAGTDAISSSIPGQQDYEKAHSNANMRAGRPNGPNNNPTNLGAFAGQPYATGKQGRWATYATVADGVAGGLHQMLLDQSRGYNTIAKEITHRSPPNENPTAEMIATISKLSGIDPNEKLDLNNPDQAFKFLKADIQREGGHASDADIRAGIAKRLHLTAMQQTAKVAGSIDANINVNAPPSTTTSVQSTGIVNSNVNLGLPVGQLP